MISHLQSSRIALLIRFSLLALLLVFSIEARAQTSNTDGTTPAALAPGAPAGSYALSGFENVNLYNGNLNFNLPLYRVSGRGGAGYTISLPIEQKWQVKQLAQVPEGELPRYTPLGTWWGLLRPGYGPGVMEGRRGGTTESAAPTDCNAFNAYEYSLTRLTFTGPDGTEFELRDQQTGGQPRWWNNVPCDTETYLRGTVFVTADGSAATFISDTQIYDYRYRQSSNDRFKPSGYLLLRDGTRYRIENGLVKWMRDPNGNAITFAYTLERVTTITDSLNRQINVSYSNGSSQLYDEISFKGFGGQPRSIKIWKASLSSVLVSGSIQTYAQLFPYMNQAAPGSNNQYNAEKISRVELPNGQSYQFGYDSYGDLVRVELPTGGRIEYEWTDSSQASEAAIYRRVTERRVYADGATLETRTTYSDPVLYSMVEVRNFDGGSPGTLLSYSKHYFYGNALDSMIDPSRTPISYAGIFEGRERGSEALATDGVTVLRRILNTWEGNGMMGGRPVNPRLTEVTTIIEPDGANLVSKQTFAHDQFNNQTEVNEYAYGIGAAGALVRHRVTSFLTTQGGLDYACDPASTCGTSATSGNAIHLRSLPIQSLIYEGSTLRAKTTFEYDNYTSDANHAGLIARGGITGFCAYYDVVGNCYSPDDQAHLPTSYATRGNLTATTQYLLNSTGGDTGFVAAYSQYDAAGNVVKVIDARGKASTFSYNDSFCNDSVRCEGTFTPNTFAFVSVVKSAKPDPSGVSGSSVELQSSTLYDFFTGLTYSITDANTQTTTLSYRDSQGNLDALDRLKTILRPDGGRTDFNYSDTPGNLSVQTLTKQDLSHNLETLQLFDGMGRAIESRRYENSGQYIAVKQIPFLSLADPDTGIWLSATRTSNPYRPYLGEQPVWTTGFSDALGRTVKVRTPDGAQVITAYGVSVSGLLGTTATVTDQAGRKRRSVTDGLGRLVRVDEPDGNGNLDDANGAVQSTLYVYDVLDNLTSVIQGTQPSRSFVYDSLKRLTAATNPESGTINYQYDNNGNLTQKTDARGVMATYAYDALNRNTSITYSNDPASTANLTHTYDGATNGKGKLWKTETSGATASRTTINTYDELGKPTSKNQQFYASGAWVAPYTISATYDKVGHPLTQTYPSSRTVSYSYDDAGRTKSFVGNLGDGATARTYASQFLYTELGGIQQEKFGTDIALYHKQRYNQRGQLWDVRLSTKCFANTPGDANCSADPADGDRGGIVNYYSNSFVQGGTGTDNNGNLLRQEIYIPGSSFFQQSYAYDSLNRLKSVAEKLNGTGADVFKQTYVYDRWGNRTISTNTNETFGGVNNLGFEVQTNKNRLLAPGDLAITDETQRRMQYDAAGNLRRDTYTGAGDRVYDAESRMTKAWGGSSQWQEYTYNGDGQRVRRKVDGVETWQVYGISGELLAEYAAGANASTPQKEYGYRNGQLLITAEPASQVTTENVVWTDAAGVTVTGNSLLKPGADGWYAGAASAQTIVSGNGYVEFTATETNKHRIVGLSHGDTDQSYGDIDFGIYPNDAGQLYVYEGGVNRGMVGTYASGNKLRVSVENGVVKYWKGGTLLYTSTVAPTYPLLVDCWLYSNSATVTSAVVSGRFTAPAQDVTWTNASGVTVTGNSLSKPGADGWYAGAASTQTIASGDGYVEFTTTETNKHRMVGLSHGDSDQSYGDIDFAIYANDQGQVHIYEFGQWVGMYSTYVSGDVLRVSVENGAVKYRKNGTLLYKSTATPAYPLLVDSWLFSNGATVTNAKISGSQGSAANLHWLVTDHLGTPRIVVDQTGSLAGVSRHDYLPFGEDLSVGRSATISYATADSVRQKFTKYERDIETGLDYANARYYANNEGRFTSPDPLISSGRATSPQSWNRYSYCLNSPLLIIDPTGLDWGFQDFWKGGHHLRKFAWFTGKVNQKGWQTYSGPSDIKLRDGSWVRLGLGTYTTIAPPPPAISLPARDKLTALAANAHGTASALTAGNPIAKVGVDWAFSKIGGVDRDSPLYGNTKAIAEGTAAGVLALGTSALGEGGAGLNARSPKLYRGLGSDHPFFEDALEGTARPFGGHSDPTLHNRGNTFSEFTSWTTDRNVAVEAAGGPDGIVLERTFRTSQLIKSQDRFLEHETLIRGLVTGAKVTTP